MNMVNSFIEKMMLYQQKPRDGIDKLSNPIPMVNGDDDCAEAFRDKILECTRQAMTCLQIANNQLENCLDDIGFWDMILGAGAGAATGAAGGAGIGAGVGVFGGGAGAVPGATIGGAIGGLGGAIGGLFLGPAHAKTKCYNKHRSMNQECNLKYRNCLDTALTDYIGCISD